MTHTELNRLALRILSSLSEDTTGAVSALPRNINSLLDDNEIPFGERRYVLMLMADTARGKACATSGPSAKILNKIGDIALDLHAQWAGVGFWARRAPFEAATRRELEVRRTEQREYDAKRELIADVIAGVSGIVTSGIVAINSVGGFKPAVISVDARTTIEAPKTEATAIEATAIEAKTIEAKAIEPEPKGKTPKRVEAVHAP